MPKSRPPYPRDLREQIVALARSGRSVAELAREFEPTQQTIRNWLVHADRDEGKPASATRKGTGSTGVRAPKRKSTRRKTAKRKGTRSTGVRKRAAKRKSTRRKTAAKRRPKSRRATTRRR